MAGDDGTHGATVLLSSWIWGHSSSAGPLLLCLLLSGMPWGDPCSPEVVTVGGRDELPASVPAADTATAAATRTTTAVTCGCGGYVTPEGGESALGGEVGGGDRGRRSVESRSAAVVDEVVGSHEACTALAN